MMRVKCFRQNDSFVLLFELKIVGGRMDSDIYWSIFSEYMNPCGPSIACKKDLVLFLTLFKSCPQLVSV